MFFFGGCTLSPMAMLFLRVFTWLRVLMRHPGDVMDFCFFCPSFFLLVASLFEGKCQIYRPPNEAPPRPA